MVDKKNKISEMVSFFIFMYVGVNDYFNKRLCYIYFYYRFNCGIIRISED